MKKNCIFLVTFIKSLNQSSIKPCLISGKLIEQMTDVCLFCFLGFVCSWKENTEKRHIVKVVSSIVNGKLTNFLGLFPSITLSTRC